MNKRMKKLAMIALATTMVGTSGIATVFADEPAAAPAEKPAAEKTDAEKAREDIANIFGDYLKNKDKKEEKDLDAAKAEIEISKRTALNTDITDAAVQAYMEVYGIEDENEAWEKALAERKAWHEEHKQAAPTSVSEMLAGSNYNEETGKFEAKAPKVATAAEINQRLADIEVVKTVLKNNNDVTQAQIEAWMAVYGVKDENEAWEQILAARKAKALPAYSVVPEEDVVAAAVTEQTGTEEEQGEAAKVVEKEAEKNNAETAKKAAEKKSNAPKTGDATDMALALGGAAAAATLAMALKRKAQK